VDEEQVEEGDTVFVTSDRMIAGRSWRGERGTVYSGFLRGAIEDWVVVRVTTADNPVDIALRPDEIEPAS
jgi:hypothetical protein